MKNIIFLFLALSVQVSLAQTQAIASNLNNWHQAAAKADFDTYFNLMASNAVFVGTDASENWTKKEFKQFSKPYFDKGKAWTFIPLERNIYVSSNKKFAWFDELLDSPHMGLVRGSGVVEFKNKQWKIKHYVLSFAIPNKKAKKVTQLKEALDKKLVKTLNQTK